jgi:hypothetical protein
VAAGFAAAVFAPETPVNGVTRGICTIQQRGMGYAPFCPSQRRVRVLICIVFAVPCAISCSCSPNVLGNGGINSPVVAFGSPVRSVCAGSQYACVLGFNGTVPSSRVCYDGS